MFLKKKSYLCGVTKIGYNSMCTCTRCGSSHVIKNGLSAGKKPRYKCKACQYQFVVNPQNKVVNATKREIVRGLLVERIGQRAICRAANVSRTWLKKFTAQEYDAMPADLNINYESLNLLDAEAENMAEIIKKN
jgi:insertion element IS1 protein InsB